MQAATDNGNHDVEQLLNLSQIAGNVGQRVKEKADGLNKGMAACLSLSLSV